MRQDLYKFEVIEEITEKVEEKTEAGVLIKDVKKEIPRTVVLKKPNSKDQREIQKVYLVKFSECVKEGILTRKNMRKCLIDSGSGFGISDFDRDRLYKLWAEIEQIQKDYIKAKLNGEKDLKGMETLFEDKMLEAQREEAALSESLSLDNTAESVAEKEQITWAAMNLSFYDTEQGEKPVIPGSNFAARWQNYDEKCNEPEKHKADLLAFNKSFLFYFFCLNNPKDYETQEQLERLEGTIDELGFKKSTGPDI